MNDQADPDSFQAAMVAVTAASLLLALVALPGATGAVPIREDLERWVVWAVVAGSMAMGCAALLAWVLVERCRTDSGSGGESA